MEVTTDPDPLLSDSLTVSTGSPAMSASTYLSDDEFEAVDRLELRGYQDATIGSHSGKQNGGQVSPSEVNDEPYFVVDDDIPREAEQGYMQGRASAYWSNSDYGQNKTFTPAVSSPGEGQNSEASMFASKETTTSSATPDSPNHNDHVDPPMSNMNIMRSVPPLEAHVDTDGDEGSQDETISAAQLLALLSAQPPKVVQEAHTLDDLMETDAEGSSRQMDDVVSSNESMAYPREASSATGLDVGEGYTGNLTSANSPSSTSPTVPFIPLTQTHSEVSKFSGNEGSSTHGPLALETPPHDVLMPVTPAPPQPPHEINLSDQVLTSLSNMFVKSMSDAMAPLMSRLDDSIKKMRTKEAETERRLAAVEHLLSKANVQQETVEAESEIPPPRSTDTPRGLWDVVGHAYARKLRRKSQDTGRGRHDRRYGDGSSSDIESEENFHSDLEVYSKPTAHFVDRRTPTKETTRPLRPRGERPFDLQADTDVSGYHRRGTRTLLRYAHKTSPSYSTGHSGRDSHINDPQRVRLIPDDFAPTLYNGTRVSRSQVPSANQRVRSGCCLAPTHRSQCNDLRSQPSRRLPSSPGISREDPNRSGYMVREDDLTCEFRHKYPPLKSSWSEWPGRPDEWNAEDYWLEQTDAPLADAPALRRSSDRFPVDVRRRKDRRSFRMWGSRSDDEGPSSRCARTEDCRPDQGRNHNEGYGTVISFHYPRTNDLRW